MVNTRAMPRVPISTLKLCGRFPSVIFSADYDEGSLKRSGYASASPKSLAKRVTSKFTNTNASTAKMELSDSESKNE